MLQWQTGARSFEFASEGERGAADQLPDPESSPDSADWYR
jgi:hypothetical protein